MPAIIKPYGRSLKDGLEWDGKILKHYGDSQTDGWEWDGKILKPYGHAPNQGWEWDGKVLKPYGRSSSHGWEWNGKIFKPYGGSLKDSWEWDGKVLKPYGRSLNDGWEIEGDAPIYIIALACNILAILSSSVDAKVTENVKNASKIKGKAKPKEFSNGEELGKILAGYLIDFIGKLVTKIINHFKK